MPFSNGYQNVMRKKVFDYSTFHRREAESNLHEFKSDPRICQGRGFGPWAWVTIALAGTGKPPRLPVQ